MEDKGPIPGREQVAEAAENVKREATSRLSSQKENVAASLSAAARAMRQTHAQLRDEDQPLVAEYSKTAANQIDRLANYVRDAELGDMVGEVERFARRQPVLFLGSAFLLGVLGARFLKSSGPASAAGNGYYRGGYYRDGAGPDYPRGSTTRTGASMGTGQSSVGSSAGYSTPGGDGANRTGTASGADGGSGLGAGRVGGSTTSGQMGSGTQPPAKPATTAPQSPSQSRPGSPIPSQGNNPTGGSGGK